MLPRDELARGVGALASEGIYVGTSSWKYEGWIGMLYDEQRYVTRGKFSLAKFQKYSLTEYAQVFKTVCLDAGFYQFPSARFLENIFNQVPSDFRMTLKVTEAITVKRFPSLPRHGIRGGQANENFLDANLFIHHFLKPLEPYQSQVGTLVFEFSRFHTGDWARGREFVAALDSFFAQLPKGWNYSVEIRNRNFLQPEYFEVLRRHRIAHTCNNWTRMPSIAQQITLPEVFTSDFTAARFLLKPGREYAQAVELFKPYNEIKDPNPEALQALIHLLNARSKLGDTKKRFLYINNRLEGCALLTIFAAINSLRSCLPENGRPEREKLKVKLLKF